MEKQLSKAKSSSKNGKKTPIAAQGINRDH
jgi:hypothetical protein